MFLRRRWDSVPQKYYSHVRNIFGGCYLDGSSKLAPDLKRRSLCIVDGKWNRFCSADNMRRRNLETAYQRHANRNGSFYFLFWPPDDWNTRAPATNVPQQSRHETKLDCSDRNIRAISFKTTRPCWHVHGRITPVGTSPHRSESTRKTLVI